MTLQNLVSSTDIGVNPEYLLAMDWSTYKSRGLEYFTASAILIATTAGFVLVRSHVNVTTVAFGLLLSVLFVARQFGSGPALWVSVLGMLGFNFFFLPPIGTLTIADPQNWVALAAFSITAISVSQLSARAERRAAEAEHKQQEIERLYQELRQAFAKASESEALKKSERLKSALLDAVSHDLHTPLTSIKVSITSLLDDDRPEGSGKLDAHSRRELMDVIDEETDRLDRFINSLVELARLEAGEFGLKRSWGVVEAITQATLERASAIALNHQLKTRLEEKLPLVRADSRALTEVLYTLVDNARKYAPAGTQILIVASRPAESVVEFAVEDEGPGIAPVFRERIFDKFFRVSTETLAQSNRPTGMGMGLAIAKGIVEAHEGKIWAEDPKFLSGARIALTIPVGDEEEPQNTQLQPVNANIGR